MSVPTHAAGPTVPVGARTRVKSILARTQPRGAADGATLLIYHRIGGGTSDELDLAAPTFARHVELSAGHDVVSLDPALDRLDAGDSSHSVVLTFDDGFDVYIATRGRCCESAAAVHHLSCNRLHGRRMRWEGSTAKGDAGQGLTWDQLREMVDSGLCTVGNHTHNHVRPEELSGQELDLCNDTVSEHLGVAPQHFTYPWGVRVDAVEPALRVAIQECVDRDHRSQHPGTNQMRLRRVPVRRTDPDRFFQGQAARPPGVQNGRMPVSCVPRRRSASRARASHPRRSESVGARCVACGTGPTRHTRSCCLATAVADVEGSCCVRRPVCTHRDLRSSGSAAKVEKRGLRTQRNRAGRQQAGHSVGHRLRHPPTAVATTGSPAAIASMIETGRPSRADARTKTSAAANRSLTSVR